MMQHQNHNLTQSPHRDESSRLMVTQNICSDLVHDQNRINQHPKPRAIQWDVKRDKRIKNSKQVAPKLDRHERPYSSVLEQTRKNGQKLENLNPNQKYGTRKNSKKKDCSANAAMSSN